MKTIKDAAYTLLLAYDKVLTQADKVSNVRASGVDDALTSITCLTEMTPQNRTEI